MKGKMNGSQARLSTTSLGSKKLSTHERSLCQATILGYNPMMDGMIDKEMIEALEFHSHYTQYGT